MKTKINKIRYFNKIRKPNIIEKQWKLKLEKLDVIKLEKPNIIEKIDKIKLGKLRELKIF